MDDILIHVGQKRRSGRYPWGTGENPFQHESWYKFLSDYKALRDRGLSEVDIANNFEMTTTQLRNQITYSTAEQRASERDAIQYWKEQGHTNTEIGKRLGISEGSVRNRLAPPRTDRVPRKTQLENIEKAILKGIEKTGHLDVGVGVEIQLGVSRSTFNAVVNHLVDKMGWNIHRIQIQRLSDENKKTTVKTLSKEPDYVKVLKDSDKIVNLDMQSEDRMMTEAKPLKQPALIDRSRIMVRYAEDGGADKDGLIELRPGVEDLDLKNSRYAQVRMGVECDLYMKGMAAYSQEKLPKGIDIVYNVTKKRGSSDSDVFKKMETDVEDRSNPESLFGTNISKQNEQATLNIINEEGDWDTWSTTISSQFLSKQPYNLIRERLGATHEELVNEYKELSSLTNPVVKKYMLEKYSDGLDSKARYLKAKGLPGTKNHVLLPMPEMRANEVYAPNYKTGDRVALVRHPHGGIFEIPDLVVNNNIKKAREMIGTDSPDAIVIHPSVAKKLSGADFDGDTVLVIPNNPGKIKSSRSLKELRNFEPNEYKITDPNHPAIIDKKNMKTIQPHVKETQMGVVSNLITDMTIKGASDTEIAKAVRHSMVIIDSEKHGLDWKQSAIDNNISSLSKKYTTRLNPKIGRDDQGASTIISRSKRNIDLKAPQKAIELARDHVYKDGSGRVKKGLSVEEIAKELGTGPEIVKGYLEGKPFNPSLLSSGSAKEEEYVKYVNRLISLQNETTKQVQTIKNPKKNTDAAKVYAPEVQSLDNKLNVALSNAPRERQAQILSNTLYYSNIKPGMDKDDLKKLKSRSLAQARSQVGAKRTPVEITDTEWEAIQAGAVSATRVSDILKNTNLDRIRELATPRQLTMTPAKANRAQALLNNGLTYAEVAQAMGVSATSIRKAIEEL